MAWQGRGKQGDIPDWIAANSVQCLGNETRFQQCRYCNFHSGHKFYRHLTLREKKLCSQSPS